MALSATNRLGIVLLKLGRSSNDEMLSFNVVQPNQEDDDESRLVGWQLVHDSEHAAEFVAVSQGSQVEILQLSFAFTGMTRLAYFVWFPKPEDSVGSDIDSLRIRSKM